MSTIYSVIGRGTEHHRVPRRSLKSLRDAFSTAEAALDLLPADADKVVPAAYAYNIDHLLTLLDHAEYLLPEIGPVWLCGYPWGMNNRCWSTWSGHEDKATAERWLKSWRESGRSLGTDNWEVRRGSCELGLFMPKGTRIRTVMAKLR